jgi:hypothetical protein
MQRQRNLKRKSYKSCFHCHATILGTPLEFDEKTFCSDKCEGLWYNKCTECSKKATMYCKCMKAGRECENNHQWHTCRVHNMRMPGTGHGSETCNCVTERKVQPTESEMLEFMNKKRKLTDAEKLDMLLKESKTTRQDVAREMQSVVEPDDDDDDV